MREALVQSNKLDVPLLLHCEDPDLTGKIGSIGNGIMNDGEISEKLSVPGIKRASEDIATQRAVSFAQESDAKIHIQHISTAGAVEIVRRAKFQDKTAKSSGFQITAETAPHYFSLTENELLSKDADFRMNPPLRTAGDVAAVLKGLEDGTINCIATDHAPHTPDEKSDFISAPNGIIGLETSFAVAITELYHKQKYSLGKIAGLLSYNGANILGLPCCNMQKGGIADIILADINRKWTVDPARFYSKSSNSPYKGRELTGQVVMTICNGKVIYSRP